jgi:hypothetical protein
MKRARGGEVCSSLPEGIRQRRHRSNTAVFHEFTDVDGMNSAIEELKGLAEAPETEIAAEKRREAKYLLNYAMEYRKLTQLTSTRSLNGTNPKVAQGRVNVFGRSFAYYSRGGVGRRYTTIERSCNKRQYGKDRDGDRWRSYSQQGCPKALRPRFVGPFCRDIDIRCCHPVIAQQQLEKLSLPPGYVKLEMSNLADYVKNRDTPGGWTDKIADRHSVSVEDQDHRKEIAKNLITRLMYGGTYERWSLDKLKSPLKHREPCVDKLRDELLKLRNAMFESDQWKGFATAEQTRQAAKGKDDEARKRATFSLILQTIENDILQTIVDAFTELDWEVTSLIYDGMHVLDNPSLDLTSALRHAERRVCEVTGYAIELTEKPLFGLQERPIDLTRV